ncbi:MAG: chemotaxis protein CheA [Planctomycetaceae bacterium]
MQIDLNRFRAAFYEEAGEHLENMEAGLLALETSGGDSEVLNTIFRAAHSIKGASSTFGMDEVAKFTHVLENLLDRMREGEILPTNDLCELLLRSTDVLSGLIQAEKNNIAPPPQVEDTFRALQQYSSASAATQAKPLASATVATQAGQTYQIQFRPSASFFHSGQNPLFLIDELRQLSTSFEVKADISRIPSLSQMDAEICYVSWEICLTATSPESALRDVFMFVDDDSTPTIRKVEESSELSASSEAHVETTAAVVESKSLSAASPSATAVLTPVTEPVAGPAETERRSGDDRRVEKKGSGAAASGAPTSSSSETVRVDRERLDKMINQIGELVIGTSMVEQDWSRFHPDTESAALVQLGKIVRDLQEMSLSLRMVPIAASFQKMTRIVRDLSHRLGKQIHLETEGEDTELDKTVVDQIGDPLLHMVRNSVDHGIELPEERIAAGKPPEGTICLKAYHQGGNFIIEIQDDGKGLDRDRILRKAIERGIVSESDDLSDEDIYGLIFSAGFSTAEQVTDVSGRGVGMDVVRRNVEALQGSISIRSQKGKGCRMIVRLPLTLAILDGLLVRVSSDSYVVPLLSVVESIKPNSSDIQKVMGKGEVITLRGEIVPLLRLDRILSLQRNHGNADDGLLVIVEDQGRKYALVVDELLGQQQVVIKNLETNFQKVPGVAGATILGDGRVALILDINGICGLSIRQGTSATDSTLAAEPACSL